MIHGTVNIVKWLVNLAISCRSLLECRNGVNIQGGIWMARLSLHYHMIGWQGVTGCVMRFLLTAIDILG